MSQNFVTTIEFESNKLAVDQRFIRLENRIEDVHDRLSLQIQNSIHEQSVRFDEKLDALELRIDKKLEALELRINKKFDEQQVLFGQQVEKYIGVVMEEFQHRLNAMFEHPKFTH